MTNNPIKVMLVDDAATIRSALKIMIRREPDMEVVAAAPNGAEAVRMAKEYLPDVILMDIEMPIMNGIESTKKIMETIPTPIVIFSSLAEESAPPTLEALANGAVDFLLKDITSKSAIDIGDLKDSLLGKIRQFGRRGKNDTRPAMAKTFLRNQEKRKAYLARRKESGRQAMALSRLTPVDSDEPLLIDAGKVVKRTGNVPKSRLPHGPCSIIAIGSSTGGPQALSAVLSAFPSKVPLPVVIVQHMPKTFIGPFADRLNRECAAEVRVARSGDKLTAGEVLLAPGDMHTRIKMRGGQLTIDLNEADVPNMLHKPSVDVLFHSLADSIGGKVIGCVLTGMGRDGALGASSLHDRGATILAQDEQSSVVYGMPRAVADAGAADLILPIEEIGDVLLEIAMRATG